MKIPFKKLRPTKKLLSQISLLFIVFCYMTVNVAAQAIYKTIETPFYDPTVVPTCPSSGVLGAYSPLFPEGQDTASLTAQVNSYINGTFPSSPFKGMGQQIVESSQAAGVNPYLVVALAVNESSLGTAKTGGVNEGPGFNAFGRSAADGQPSFPWTVKGGPGNWYKWSSWEDSINSKIDPATTSEEDYIKTVYLDQGVTDLMQFASKYLTGNINGKEDGAGNRVDKYYNNLVTTFDKISGGSGAASASGGSTTNCASACGTGSNASSSNTVVLDPGHVPGSTPSDERDSVTGLYVMDYDNPTQERVNAYNVSVKIGDKLKAAGINVVNSKSSVDDKFNLAERAQKDNAAKPALVVVLHGNNDGVRSLIYPDSNSKRTPQGDTRKDGTDGLVYPNIMAPSESFAKKMAPVVAKGVSGYKAETFQGVYGTNGLIGNGLNSGNTPVQTILSSVPEVYSEVDNSVLGTDEFADAMANAIKQVVSVAQPSGAQPDDTVATAGCSKVDAMFQKIVEYAWPQNWNAASTERPSETTMKAAYAAAIQAGTYAGSCAGVDCGAFVTAVMRNSGADPQYNTGPEGDTGAQLDYLIRSSSGSSAKYQQLKITNADQLQPGDIAVQNNASRHHTFIYVGKAIPGWGDVVASASQCDRAPEASGLDVIGDFEWFRLL